MPVVSLARTQCPAVVTASATTSTPEVNDMGLEAANTGNATLTQILQNL